jgi:hypothetical protein
MDKQVRARPSKWTDLCARRTKMDNFVRACASAERRFPEESCSFVPPLNPTNLTRGRWGVGRPKPPPTLPSTSHVLGEEKTRLFGVSRLRITAGSLDTP